MSIRRSITISVAGLLAAIGISTGVAYAASSNQVVQGTTNQSVYKTGDTVTVNGVVNGDVYCAGQTITIDATVNGDVLCAGQSIDVNGVINGNVRLIGQTVTVSAKIARSASIVGQSATVSSGAIIGQDLSLTTQSATIDGTVNRDVTGAVGNAAIGGTIGRNATFVVNGLTLNSGARITGDLTYTSPKRLEQNSGAHISGTTTYHQGQTHHVSITYEPIWLQLYWILAMIVLGVVLAALFPQLFRRVNPVWGAGFWWAMLTGFVAMFAVPIIIGILLFTAIGVPLAILLGLIWAAMILASIPIAAYFTGSLLMPKHHPILIILVGTVVLGILWIIPFIGWLIGAIVVWVGTGILLLGLRRHYPRPAFQAKE